MCRGKQRYIGRVSERERKIFSSVVSSVGGSKKLALFWLNFFFYKIDILL